MLSIFADSDRNLWLGTQAGMMRLSRTPVRVLALSEAADSDFGTVALDTDGSLWAASNQLVHVQGRPCCAFQISRSWVTCGFATCCAVGMDRFGSEPTAAASTIFPLMERRISRRSEGLVNNFVRVFLESKDGSSVDRDRQWRESSRSCEVFTVSPAQNGLVYNSIRSLTGRPGWNYLDRHRAWAESATGMENSITTR